MSRKDVELLSNVFFELSELVAIKHALVDISVHEKCRAHGYIQAYATLRGVMGGAAKAAAHDLLRGRLAERGPNFPRKGLA